jgi:hypothetical protein
MPSRFGLDAEAFRPKPPEFKHTEPGADRYDMPTCNNCRAGACNRCPTAITIHGVTGWSSDFECRCYWDDERRHGGLVEADNEEFNRSSSGGWSGGEYRPEGGGWTDWGR